MNIEAKLAEAIALLGEAASYTGSESWSPSLTKEITKFVANARAVLAAHEAAKAQPATNIRERWNIERDGDDLLVCFNLHEKGDACEYVRFVRASQAEAQPVALSERVERLFADIQTWADKWAMACMKTTNPRLMHEQRKMAQAWQSDLRAMLAAPQPAAVPAGYALVPVEPTPEMTMAGNRARLHREHGSLESHEVLKARTFNTQQAWAAMLAAAPQPAQATASQKGARDE